MEKEKIFKKIWNYFQCSKDEFLEVAKDITERAFLEISDSKGKIETEKAVSRAIDNGLIWGSWQWAVMAHYQAPKEADYQIAETLFEEDIVKIVNDLRD